MTAAITTREGIVVKVGQVWRDLDPRCLRDKCTIAAVYINGYCSMTNNAIPGSRKTRVRINRMHKSVNGWALVSEAP